MKTLFETYVAVESAMVSPARCEWLVIVCIIHVMVFDLAGYLTPVRIRIRRHTESHIIFHGRALTPKL